MSAGPSWALLLIASAAGALGALVGMRLSRLRHRRKRLRRGHPEEAHDPGGK